MNKHILKNAVVSAGATTVYVIGVATFLFNAERIFGGEPDGPLATAALLLLFVISAAVTGFAVIGRPVMWYIDGKKKEAVLLLASTLVCLALVALFLLSIL